VQAARLEAGAEALQSVPRGNLRVPASIGEPGCFDAYLARVQALGLEACEPRPVDGLEWQAPLKTGFRGRVELGRCLERPPPERLFAMTGEAERPWLGTCGSPQLA
jgi:hypothetical protein